MEKSASEMAKEWKISKRRVQLLCEQGRVEGAKLVDGSWRIPSLARKPEDGRKYPAFRTEEEGMTLLQVCQRLSISEQTARNWIRLGRLSLLRDEKFFSKRQVEDLAKRIESGEENLLKSRRNKREIRGRKLYKGYVKNAESEKMVGRLVECFPNVDEKTKRLFLAHYFIEFYCQSRNISLDHENYIGEIRKIDDETFFYLVHEMLKGYAELEELDSVQDALSDYVLSFLPGEDVLGLLFLSLCDAGERKRNGAYYTPSVLVNQLVDQVLKEGHGETSFLDPCCGTGNFLLALARKGVSSSSLYGQEMDPVSALIARMNLFLMDRGWAKDALCSHIREGDSLRDSFSRTFSVVLGNPPWGSSFSAEEKAFFLSRYRLAKKRGTEAFDLFVEKGLSLLQEGGILAYVLPEAFLTVRCHRKALELVQEQTSLLFVSYLGNAFSSILCPTILLGVQKGGKEKTWDALSFCQDEREEACLLSIEKVREACFLKDHAHFALGIVTGDNKRFLSDESGEGKEPIVRGSDVFRYHIQDPKTFVSFSPASFQQVAKTEFYRAKEKIFYRFISEVPVFAYDDRKRLSLNSCNILIPEIEEMEMKYVLALLNSSVVAFYLRMKFHSVKLLRSHLESIPLPRADLETQKRVIDKVEELERRQDKKEEIYRRLDDIIFDLYSLTKEERETIKKALSGKSLFLS